MKVYCCYFDLFVTDLLWGQTDYLYDFGFMLACVGVLHAHTLAATCPYACRPELASTET